MPRILRIINRLNLGGPTWNAALLTKHLAPEYETVLVSGQISEDETSSEHIVASMNLTPVYVNGMYREVNLLNDAHAFLQLQRLIRQFRPHIVHTHAAKAGALGRVAAWWAKVPVVVHTFHGHVFHSYFSKTQSRLFVQLERLLASYSHAIITVSPLLKKELVEQYRICRHDKVEVIPVGLDLEKFRNNQQQLRQNFRKRYGIGEQEVVVSFVGRLVAIKNHSMFLKAIREVSTRCNAPLRVFVVGDGEERKALESLARSLGLQVALPAQAPKQTTVTFTSWIKEVEQVYAGSDVVALTSLNEGTPLTLIEAQAAGKAVVATKVGGVADVVEDGKTGLLVGRQDLHGLVQALFKVIQNQGLREALGARASQEAFQRHDYRNMVAQTATLYRRLLQRMSD
ncbi:MAG: glycosyltransferase family 4 protein [Chitinophagales bacterium]|nr:glycosyltransferase family 4 protein [Chitinophagales bacterium]MDW8428086.1 glycosyltransferase family 4 protein [Chitinophagales bacterium]